VTPDYRNRTAEQIASEDIFHDAIGFGYRAASWLDYAKRTENFAAAQYAAIDGRLSIEHLVFELLVITSGPELTEENYKRCLNEPRKLQKLLNQIVPDYDKLVHFSALIASMEPGIPEINTWDIRELMRSWGVLSENLHWSGAHVQTTENSKWQADTLEKIAGVVEPYWERMSLGRSGCMRVESMDSKVQEIWEDFKSGTIEVSSAKTRLELIRPLLKNYA